MVVAEGAKRSILADWSRRGLAQPQDPTSAQVVEHLDVIGGDAVCNVLDRCAGLGTKTMQIAERLGPSGSVVAVDPNRARCDTLRQTTVDRGLVERVFVFNKSWMNEFWHLGTVEKALHRVLIDAPCSNSGVLARRPEARYTQDAASLASVRKLQLDILDDTAPYVLPDGLLLYSTCSIWPEENESVVSEFVSRHPEYRLLDSHRTLPSLTSAEATTYRDGGFWALLRRAD
jgi:16S rRNA (cytosine967-C5)-methyltransferase